MIQSPILFIIFNRPDTTSKVFESIRVAKPKKLFIAADGPRNHKPGEKELCQKARQIAVNVDWECEVQTLFREENLGCGRGPAEAITWFFEHVDQGIILEDDCLPDQSFFFYCESLLHQYKQNENIMHISGNNFQYGRTWGEGSYYFSRYINAWGWATWKRAWQHYDFYLKDYASENIENLLLRSLSTKKERRFWKDHFELVKGGKRSDIWDYQWVYTVWRLNGVSIMPNVNLVKNIGFGSDATHTFDADSKLANNPVHGLVEIKHPINPKVFRKADKRLFHTCYEPKLTIMDRVYLLKQRIKNIVANLLKLYRTED